MLRAKNINKLSEQSHRQKKLAYKYLWEPEFK